MAFKIEITYPNGDRYEGEIEESQGKRHGKGTMFYNTGERYIGEWNMDQETGHGIKYFADGNKYEGNKRFNLSLIS